MSLIVGVGKAVMVSVPLLYSSLSDYVYRSKNGPIWTHTDFRVPISWILSDFDETNAMYCGVHFSTDCSGSPVGLADIDYCGAFRRLI
jgi:hypothetical protein